MRLAFSLIKVCIENVVVANVLICGTEVQNRGFCTLDIPGHFVQEIIEIM